MKYINIRRKTVCAAFLAAMAALLCTGCGGNAKSGTIAMITDGGSTEEAGTNQDVWQGVQQYAAETGKTAKVYQPEQADLASLEQAVDEAVSDGAEIIVCAGESFENAVYDMQRMERDTRFILLEGVPENEEGDRKIRGNTSSVLSERAQAGFLAGYAAVKEGYTSLGFLGGEESEENIRYGSGYVQGANQAAADLGLAAGQVTIRYRFLGSDSVSPSLLQEIQSWYQQGCQLIYACGSAPELLAEKGAEAAGGKLISTEPNETPQSSAVLSAAGTDYCQMAYQALKMEEEGSLPGGKETMMGIPEGGVVLRMENAGFSSFTQTDYDLLVQRIENGEIRVTEEDVTQNLNNFEITLVSFSREN